jgi:hypothetical protein
MTFEDETKLQINTLLHLVLMSTTNSHMFRIVTKVIYKAQVMLRKI